MLEMMSEDPTDAGQHVTSNIACVCSQWYTSNSFFWLAKMMLSIYCWCFVNSCFLLDQTSFLNAWTCMLSVINCARIPRTPGGCWGAGGGIVSRHQSTCSRRPVHSHLRQQLRQTHRLPRTHDLSMYIVCSQYVQRMFSVCTANVLSMYSECSQYVQRMFSVCTAYVLSMYSEWPQYALNI